MRGARKITTTAGWALLLVAALPPLEAAEVLVFRGGDAFVRTQGPWQERGGRLIFRDAAGCLYSVALGEVDLPRSRELAARVAREGLAALAGLVPAGPVADTRELADADIPDALKHRGEEVEESREEENRSREATLRRRPPPRRAAERTPPKLRRAPPPAPAPPGGKPSSGPRPRRP